MATVGWIKPPKLSICIATLNRGHLIGDTLESIRRQMTPECEIVVLDGASTDNTEALLSTYAKSHPGVRYFRQATNSGIDRDYDKAVQFARGEYCWLMSDDDLLMPGAITAVLDTLSGSPSLVVVNVEARSTDMSALVQRRFLDFDVDRIYEPAEMDRLFSDIANRLAGYVGCMVIRRDIWIERERERYFGSLYVYLGVIFQRPLPGRAMIIAQPLVSYRAATEHTFSSRLFEVMCIRWPSIVWSLALSEHTKRQVCPPEAWRRFPNLFLARGFGLYGPAEFRRYVLPLSKSSRTAFFPAVAARFPGALANLLCIFSYKLSKSAIADYQLYMLRKSQFYPFGRLP